MWCSWLSLSLFPHWINPFICFQITLIWLFFFFFSGHFLDNLALLIDLLRPGGKTRLGHKLWPAGLIVHELSFLHRKGYSEDHLYPCSSLLWWAALLFQSLREIHKHSLGVWSGLFSPQNSSSTQILPDRPRQAPLSAFFSASPSPLLQHFLIPICMLV